MGNAFRLQPGPALYPPNATPFMEDVEEVGILVAFGMIAFSFILIIPGIRGWERLYSVIRVFTALWIGAVILVCSFGYTWHTADICVRAQYKAYVSPINRAQEIQAAVGLHVGLRGFNVTLREVPYVQCTGNGTDAEAMEYWNNRPFPTEIIDYNEQFRWNNPWAQGRVGFGIFAGEVSQEFRAGEFRGLPYPILWIAEYFTLDGEQIRWFRKYRQAGWYAHILLWLAFTTYLLSIVLFIFVISTAAWFMLYTGLFMVLASFAYSIIIINDPVMEIPFGDIEGHRVALVLHHGWAYIINIVTGCGTTLLACLILILNFFFPRQVATFFHHTVVEEDEFFQIDEEEEAEKGLDDFGVSTRRGGTTRGRTQRRGVSKYRQTTRKPRSTIRSTRGGSQRLNDEIQLQEVSTVES